MIHECALPFTRTYLELPSPSFFQLDLKLETIYFQPCLKLQACPTAEWEPRRRWRVVEASPICNSSKIRHGNNLSSITNISSTETSSGRRPPRWAAGAELGHLRRDR